MCLLQEFFTDGVPESLCSLLSSWLKFNITLHEETDGEDETRTSPHSALWVAITACVALALVAVATMGWILLSTRE